MPGGRRDAHRARCRDRRAVSEAVPPAHQALHTLHARGDELALRDAGLGPDAAAPERVGVCLGTGTSGYDNDRTAADDGSELPGVWDVLKRMPCAVASLTSVQHGFQGPALTVSTACSSGASAVGLAHDLVTRGETDVVITGGYDFGVTMGALHGFGALMVLSQHNEVPESACRPFDANRDGMVLGDGVGILVLERAGHAAARGVRPYAVMSGYAITSEAASLIAPAPDGARMARTMRLALQRAGVASSDIDWVNAHGTATLLNDECESRAIRTVFGTHADRLMVSSLKSMLGHAIGASGGIQAVTSALALGDQLVPPTINWDSPGRGCDLDYVPGRARRTRVRGVVVNAFAFGGHNCSLVLTAPDGTARTPASLAEAR